MEEDIAKVELDEIVERYKVKDSENFICYLKEVFYDLSHRTTDKKGITKLILYSYYPLPGIIGDRFFCALTDSDIILVDGFVKGMNILFCEPFEKDSKFIFDFYDFDKDGLIDREDIRTVLSYISLVHSEESSMYKERVKSQAEIYEILEKCFVDISYMDYERFKTTVENICSDIYLMILLFLFEKKPFTNANLENYQKQLMHRSKRTYSVNVRPSAKLVATPSKDFSFLPYQYLQKFQRKRKQTMTEGKSEMSKVFDSPKKKLINSSVKLSNDELRLLPAFKQTNNSPTLIRASSDETETTSSISNNGLAALRPSEAVEPDCLLRFDSVDEEENENDDDSQKEKEQVVKNEGFLCKFVEGKMRKLWFKLIHKDLYFFKKQTDTTHKGMHNLSGVFLEEEPLKIITEKDEEKTYYAFSITYPSKKRTYYVDNQEEYVKWIEALKVATEYTNLTDIYEVRNQLGKGKFGVVKLGINKKTKERVAIKILCKKKMAEKDLEMVRTEIEILKVCQHPNIIHLHDVFENLDYFYIIMEYCEGGDMFTYLEARSFKIPEKTACNLVHKLCAAVFYMHSYGIAHRDLKPENILMTSKEDDADIRILDFGLSKIIGPQEKCTEPYGTLTYVAPEILLDEPYSKEVDLWSIGIITYLLLCGRLPFNDPESNEDNIANKIVNDTVSFKGQRWEKISIEAREFIYSLLEKDPKKRMTIQDALEHLWITKFCGKDMTYVRKMSKNMKGSTFEVYSSTK